MAKTIPTYVIDGFLEAGKTTFIKDTIASDDFFKKGKTLVISGEQGEVEYDDSFLEKYNTVVKYVENQEDFNPSSIMQMIKELMPDRIVIELNGMWDLKLIEFPSLLKVYQFIYFINYQTFPIYFANMRQKFTDAIAQSNVVVFINVNSNQMDELDTYSQSFRLTNNNAQFMVMDRQGRLIDAFKKVYPYDKDAKVIKIKDEDYGFFYIDTFEAKEVYESKMVEFNAMVVLSNKLPKNTFIAGRLAMTCCSNDIQLYGHLCLNTTNIKLKDRSFVHILAIAKYEWSEQYKEEELVLYPSSIENIAPLENPVLDLTK